MTGSKNTAKITTEEWRKTAKCKCQKTLKCHSCQVLTFLLAICLVLSLLLTGCDLKGKDAKEFKPQSPLKAALILSNDMSAVQRRDMVAGFVNFAAQKSVKANYLDKVKPEMLQDLLKLLYKEKYNLLFLSGSGMENEVKTLASEYPDVAFCLIGGTLSRKNVFSFQIKREEKLYLAGAVASTLSEQKEIAVLTDLGDLEAKNSLTALQEGADLTGKGSKITPLSFAKDTPYAVKTALKALEKHKAILVIDTIESANTAAVIAAHLLGRDILSFTESKLIPEDQLQKYQASFARKNSENASEGNAEKSDSKKEDAENAEQENKVTTVTTAAGSHTTSANKQTLPLSLPAIVSNSVPKEGKVPGKTDMKNLVMAAVCTDYNKLFTHIYALLTSGNFPATVSRVGIKEEVIKFSCHSQKVETSTLEAITKIVELIKSGAVAEAQAK